MIYDTNVKTMTVDTGVDFGWPVNTHTQTYTSILQIRHIVKQIGQTLKKRSPRKEMQVTPTMCTGHTCSVKYTQMHTHTSLTPVCKWTTT